MKTSNNASVDIVLLLDRSGSMDVIRDATIDAVNEFLFEQRSAEGDASLTLVLFDTVVTVLLEGRDLDAVPPMTRQVYVPRGRTALLDAWGNTMSATEARLAKLPEERRPEEVIFAVMTDGRENASTEWDAASVFRAVEEKQNRLGWRFVFLGADQDAIREARRYGVRDQSAMRWAKSARGARSAMSALSRSVNRSRERRPEAGAFTDDDRDEQRRLERAEREKKRRHRRHADGKRRHSSKEK